MKKSVSWSKELEKIIDYDQVEMDIKYEEIIDYEFPVKKCRV